MSTATAETLVVRHAGQSDEARLVEMGLRFLRESNYSRHLKENAAQMRKFTQQMLANPKAHFLVVERAGETVGMLALLFYPHYFSGELVAGEVVWWVEPEHRKGSGAGMALLHAAERLARAEGARKMQMIAPSEELGKLYERLGYQRVETTYQRSLS